MSCHASGRHSSLGQGAIHAASPPFPPDGQNRRSPQTTHIPATAGRLAAAGQRRGAVARLQTGWLRGGSVLVSAAAAALQLADDPCECRNHRVLPLRAAEDCRPVELGSLGGGPAHPPDGHLRAHHDIDQPDALHVLIPASEARRDEVRPNAVAATGARTRTTRALARAHGHGCMHMHAHPLRPRYCAFIR